MLTSGRVRAFRKDAGSGKQVQLGDLAEGAFFGEMSILTGKPRMASVVALTRCELLELDRPTLDGITQTHPHVWDVLREFAAQRARAARRLSASRAFEGRGPGPQGAGAWPRASARVPRRVPVRSAKYSQNITPPRWWSST